VAPSENLGAALAASRRRRGLTQIDLASRLGVSPSTVCRWERGWNRPRPRRLRSLGHVLAVPASVLRATRRARPAANRPLTRARVAAIVTALRGVADELRRA
jgi:transcriptional regulator with XRE-family HTH domain